MPRGRTGNVEKFRRKDGSVYYKARIRLADKTRDVDAIPEEARHDRDDAAERRELYGQLAAAAGRRRPEDTL